MAWRERLLRAVVGVAVLLVLCIGGFAIAGAMIPTWGATDAEVARTLPGDELIAKPLVNWTHAITIDAPQAQVWGWIAQIGERRGAFYSYTFIENQMGNGDVYHNADRIVPEWQNTKPGDAIIGGALPLQIHQITPGESMIAYQSGDFQWLWGWFLEPINANQTRLVVRMKIQAAGMDGPIVGNIVNYGAFIMEQGMLQGIKTRAEGNVPPAYTETLGIILWALALFAGVISGVMFVAVKEWNVALGIGALAVVAIFIFTFWQPPIWTRVLGDAALYGGVAMLVMDQWFKSSSRTTHRERPHSMPLNPAT